MQSQQKQGPSMLTTLKNKLLDFIFPKPAISVEKFQFAKLDTLDPSPHLKKNPSKHPQTPRTQKPLSEPIPDEVIGFCQKKIEELLTLCDIQGVLSFDKQEDGELLFDISESQDSGRLIGKDGNTLEAFQTLLKAFVFKQFSRSIRIRLDVANYRKKRIDSLKGQALKLSDGLTQKGNRGEMKTLSPEDRRIIHELFEKNKQFRTFSVGDGFYRKVIIERRI